MSVSNDMVDHCQQLKKQDVPKNLKNDEEPVEKRSRQVRSGQLGSVARKTKKAGRERACIGGGASTRVAESGGEEIRSSRRGAMKNEQISRVVGAGSVVSARSRGEQLSSGQGGNGACRERAGRVCRPRAGSSGSSAKEGAVRNCLSALQQPMEWERGNRSGSQYRGGRRAAAMGCDGGGNSGIDGKQGSAPSSRKVRNRASGGDHKEHRAMLEVGRRGNGGGHQTKAARVTEALERGNGGV
ncbi:hypothetical protein B0H14DRAFT_3139505 [Mycena olivaceomarginata]|nr:hypothetical protein B0H14DRAFT_3139505 [Mycena olivaceomarginata]